MTQVGLGIIGAGIIGDIHALTYSRLPHANLVAVCDLDEARAATVAQQYGASAVYTDYHNLLANPAVEAVSVVTPDFAHRDIAVACANARKHILVEKPLATTVADAEAILQAVDEAGVKLMVDFHNRCNPPFVHARDSIRQGNIGQPSYLYARLSNTTYVATQMLSWASQTSVLWFLTSHTLDLACWLLDDTPQRVYAVSRAGVLQQRGIDTPDFYSAIVEFRKGAVVTLENAWILPESEPVVYNFKFEILGSEGTIYINTSDHRAIEQYTQPDRTSLPDVLGMTPTSSLRTGGFMQEAIARFVDTVAYDHPLLATGEDGLRVTRTLVAIQESVKSGQPVDL